MSTPFYMRKLIIRERTRGTKPLRLIRSSYYDFGNICRNNFITQTRPTRVTFRERKNFWFVRRMEPRKQGLIDARINFTRKSLPIQRMSVERGKWKRMGKIIDSQYTSEKVVKKRTKKKKKKKKRRRKKKVEVQDYYNEEEKEGRQVSEGKNKRYLGNRTRLVVDIPGGFDLEEIGSW